MTAICKVNYPLYCCQCLDNEAFVVAGGGGASKTGVRNSVVSVKEIVFIHSIENNCLVSY